MLVDMGRPEPAAALSIIAWDALICPATTGDSTLVSDDMTCTGFESLSAGRADRAFHTICTMHVESLPPLNPSIHGLESPRYTSLISSYMSPSGREANADAAN